MVTGCSRTEVKIRKNDRSKHLIQVASRNNMENKKEITWEEKLEYKQLFHGILRRMKWGRSWAVKWGK